MVTGATAVQARTPQLGALRGLVIGLIAAALITGFKLLFTHIDRRTYTVSPLLRRGQW